MLTTIFMGLMLSSSAFAQEGWDGHGYEPAGDDGDLEDLLTTWRPETQTPGSFGGSVLFEYAESPVVLYERNLQTEEVTAERLLDDVLALNLNAQGSFHEQFSIAVSAPIWLATSGVGGPQGAGLGDLRVALPVTAYVNDTDSRRFRLGLVPSVDLPTGNQLEFTGNSGVALGALATGSYGSERWLASVNLGSEALPSVDFENVRGGFRGIGSVGFSVLASEMWAFRMESIARPKLVQGAVPGRESPVEALASIRGRSETGWNWTFGSSVGISPGWSAAAYRVFAGAGFAFGKGPFDADGDGFVDDRDGCPQEAETVNGFEDSDGCPDALALLTVTVVDPEGTPVPNASIVVGGEVVGDTDAEGRLRIDNQTPGSTLGGDVNVSPATALDGGKLAEIELIPGPQEATVQLDWLPGAIRVVTRSDEGAILDAEVTFKGPNSFGPVALGGDGQGLFVLEPGDWMVLAAADIFGIERREVTIRPDEDTLVVIEVILSPAVVATTKEEVVILQSVEFDFDKATVKADSMDLLTEVANNLIAFEEINQVEVQGHTDSKGSNSYNRRLAQKRVDAVMAILIEQGVEAERLIAVGYGEQCAIAENSTDEGRATNRRVQFMVTDPLPEGGIPCHEGVPARRADPTTVKRTVMEGSKEAAPAPEAGPETEAGEEP
jgi:outer membrane protein OmpA-like peptidoglycan-associated protein